MNPPGALGEEVEGAGVLGVGMRGGRWCLAGAELDTQ